MDTTFPGKNSENHISKDDREATRESTDATQGREDFVTDETVPSNPHDTGFEATSDEQLTADVFHMSSARPMQKKRFLLGLASTTAGISVMLFIAAGTLHGLGINGRLSLPVVGLCMILGLMLLGGGFGVMATAAPTFDDGEFDRLMTGVKIPATEEDAVSDASAFPAEPSQFPQEAEFKKRPGTLRADLSQHP